MMALQRHVITKGDTRTPLAVQLKQKDSSGILQPVDLSGLTVKFNMVADDGTSVVANGTTGVTVNSAALGKVQYDFQSGDVDTAGTFYAWFKVYQGTECDTFPVDGRKLRIEIVDMA